MSKILSLQIIQLPKFRINLIKKVTKITWNYIPEKESKIKLYFNCSNLILTSFFPTLDNSFYNLCLICL